MYFKTYPTLFSSEMWKVEVALSRLKGKPLQWFQPQMDQYVEDRADHTTLELYSSFNMFKQELT